MDDRPPLTGRNLRYLLAHHLWSRHPVGGATVAELVAVVERAGFRVPGRPTKTVSDALRWEIAHGRVVRLAWGRYGPGVAPRQTRDWIRDRVDGLLVGR